MEARSLLRLARMPPAPVDGTVLDQLHSALGGDTALLQRVIDNYLDGMDGRLEALRRAVEREPKNLERAAHALASPSATLGVRCIAEPCMAIERAVEAGRPPRDLIAQLLGKVEAAVEPARTALRSWLERRAA